MKDTVLDASVFVASISPTEVHHATALRLMGQMPETRAFLVPALFRVEVIAALARRGATREYLDLLDALVTGRKFLSISLDDRLLAKAAEVARTARLRAYDAVYVALAMVSDAELLTLDSEVRDRIVAAYPDIELFTELLGGAAAT